ncbi:Aste57867_9995 [Aphanomyces stellatus]|uniref:Aste57867_9995 protein n=1 Tax=Aphanomyces stellatus TaxID=120398 RepID=A0A485KPX0_9STRA|nr:hypothetical protein As57867_009956 [Aphanomyces stellatus]VFT86873.1 Aste57867_9995 [Aphanomyces stellatus]
MLRYLVATVPPQDPVQVLLDAAAMGHIPSFRFLLDQFPTACHVNAIGSAAYRGHLNIVKFLHQDLRCPGCTTSAMDEAATYGHLDVVQWLHENRQKGCSARAMTAAASLGRLAVVQFLATHRTEGDLHEALNACTRCAHVQVYLKKLIFFGGPVSLAHAQAIENGTGVHPLYARTPDDDVTNMRVEFVSISAMPAYATPSVEELRWEDYLKRQG